MNTSIMARRTGLSTLLAVGATGILVLPAAAGPPVDTYTSIADAGGIVLELNLPPESGLPSPATIVLSESTGMDSTDPGQRSATARGALAGGTVISGEGAPLAPLDTAAVATADSPSANQSLAEFPDNPMAAGGVGLLLADVTDTGTNSSAALTDISALTFADIAPPEALAGFDEAVSQILPPLQEGMLAGLDALGPLVEADPTGSFAEVESTFRLFINALPSVASSVPQSPFAVIEGLTTTQSTSVGTDTARATAGVSIESVSLLGGFLDINSLTSSAMAIASTEAGGASSQANPVLARTTFGMGLIGARLDSAGLGLNLPGFPQDAAAQISDGITQFNAALDTALEATGISIATVDPVTMVGADGHTAAATGGALVVTVDPEGSGEPVLRLRLGATDATASVTAAAPAPEPQPEPEPEPDVGTDPDTQLPTTGDAGLVGIGVLSAAVAVVSRRRLLAH